MTEELSYPSLRCVLEHMDANKRIHMAARSPVIRDFDRSIPIRFESIGFSNDTVQINDTCYTINAYVEELPENDPKFENKPEVLMAGDIKFGGKNRTRSSEFLQLEFIDANNGERISRRIPDGLPIHIAKKTLANKILGYKSIFVEYLKFAPFGSSILHLPVGIKFMVRCLNTTDNSIDDCLQLVDPSSLPLLKLSINSMNAESLEHPEIKKAGMLLLESPEIEIPMEVLVELPNENIVCCCLLSFDQVSRFVENWEKKGSTNIKRLGFLAPNYQFVERVMDTFVLQENPKRQKLDFMKINISLECESMPDGTVMVVLVNRGYSV